jgi:hypothetical protein
VDQGPTEVVLTPQLVDDGSGLGAGGVSMNSNESSEIGLEAMVRAGWRQEGGTGSIEDEKGEGGVSVVEEWPKLAMDFNFDPVPSRRR